MSRITKFYKSFLEYTRNLKFYEKPNYEYLEGLLNYCAKENNIILSQFNFDWVIRKQKKEFDKNKFKKIDNKEFDNISDNSNISVAPNDKNIIETYYVGKKNSFKINKILRTQGPLGLDEEDKNLYDVLNKVIREYQTEKDYFVYRYVDYNYIRDVFNFIPSNDINYNLNQIIKHIGANKIEKGFMSCAMTDKHIIEGNIKLQIKIPKGTNANITNNKKESEIILPNNSQYQILNAQLQGNTILIDIGILNKNVENIYFD